MVVTKNDVVNLDGRYYTKTESDALYTKKLGQGGIG